jgi:hypothetical protein
MPVDKLLIDRVVMSLDKVLQITFSPKELYKPPLPQV